MARTRKQTKTYNGFAIPLEPDTELGLAMLIAEDEDGHYEPVAVAATINEAKEIAESDLRGRMRSIARGEDAGICPLCRARHNGHYAESRIMPSKAGWRRRSSMMKGHRRSAEPNELGIV
jgi:hypothetical protein